MAAEKTKDSILASFASLRLGLPFVLDRFQASDNVPREMGMLGKIPSGLPPMLVRLRAGLAAIFLVIFLMNSKGQSLGISIQPSSGSIILGNQVTYTILVTNALVVAVQNFLVTNSFAPAQFISASGTSFGNQVFTFSNSTSATFYIQRFPPGNTADLTVTVQPTVAGSFTNITSFFSGSPAMLFISNVVIEVTAPPADLGVSMVGPAPGILVGDWVSYSVTATNNGPNDSPGVALANRLPAGAQLISLSPSNPPVTLSNSVVLLSLGTLTNGHGETFNFVVQPTQPGPQTISAAIMSTSTVDTNAANDLASTQVNVGTFLPADLVATNASAMTYNPQTALMEQMVELSNVGTSSVPSARVIVSGLTNRLYNAVGTNNGNPFVVYGAPLDPGQSVGLRMEYFVPTRLPILVPNSAYQAVGVPTNSPPVPPGAPFAVTRIVALAPGSILVEFPSIAGRTYTILYSDNAGFTNALAAQPAIVAPADRVQWIDDGPPKTVSAPASAAQRFYRVLLNP